MVLVRNIRLLHVIIHLLRNAAKGTSTESKETPAKNNENEHVLRATRGTPQSIKALTRFWRPRKVREASRKGSARLSARMVSKRELNKCLRKDSPQGPRKAQKMTRRAPARVLNSYSARISRW